MEFRAFYFNAVGGIPLSVQQEAAIKDGWREGFPKTYIETRKSYPRQRNACFGDLRKNADDGIWVYAFVCIAPQKRDLKKIRPALAKFGAYIYEGKTGWTTKGKRYGQILEHSIRYWSRGRLTHEQAVEFGSKGGEISVKARKASTNRMPLRDALRIWRDPKYEHEDDALEAINADDRYQPYASRSTAYRLLGDRGLPSGPAPKGGRK